LLGVILALAAAPVVIQAQILVAIQALTPAGYFANSLINVYTILFIKNVTISRGSKIED